MIRHKETPRNINMKERGKEPHEGVRVDRGSWGLECCLAHQVERWGPLNTSSLFSNAIPWEEPRVGPGSHHHKGQRSWDKHIDGKGRKSVWKPPPVCWGEGAEQGTASGFVSGPSQSITHPCQARAQQGTTGTIR